MANTIKIVKKRSKNRFGKNKADALKVQRLFWLTGHSVTLVCGLLFGVTYFFHVLLFFKYRSWKWLFLRVNENYSVIKGHRWYHSILRSTPQLLYRMSLIGVFSASGVTMYQNWGGLRPTWFDLLSSANFQATIIAVLWFLGGGKSIYRLLPFMILSFIHLKHYKTEFETEDRESVEKLSLENKELLHLIAYSEVFIAVTLLLDTLLMKNGETGFMFVIYAGFYWIRLNFSLYTQATVIRLLNKFEKKVPPKYYKQWNVVKKFLIGKVKNRKDNIEKATKNA
ncbi:uncharacterized protein KNAG_0D03860 [Huiozyma naganishii CBS 8797]|uniref:Uncharacterized protein n=1 Tax=Huiozyma naganishii (strain ATCC MYA-139 / BCRC 22969 / CBS 8797 / KCTC 17520 / NBRC 10181 / NCYC 3082 / Yp74L-3) TaxID=1071383 RepID=J7RYB4_HUIN7|nr:hypothetical protein KNAG_0D03860 [Kazachstania naganishii CBS 8797]CCK70132.1 hypothetical protein KNAG_0D03860 [Kazachstania naganishii CBS 8797]